MHLCKATLGQHFKGTYRVLHDCQTCHALPGRDAPDRLLCLSTATQGRAHTSVAYVCLPHYDLELHVLKHAYVYYTTRYVMTTREPGKSRHVYAYDVRAHVRWYA